MVEINESERIKEKRIKRNEDNLRDLQDNIKRYNIRIIGVPEEDITEGNALEATGNRSKPCGYYGLHRKGPIDLEKYKSDQRTSQK